VGLFAAEGEAVATPEFPGIVQDTWKVRLPGMGCTLCHADESTAAPKRVTTKVGLWFYGQGLVALKDTKLKELLAASKSTGQDSDDDGFADYQELVDGTDPNDAQDFERPPPMDVPDGGDAAVPVSPPPVTTPKPHHASAVPRFETGCSVRPQSTGSLVSSLALGIAVAAVTVARRRRRHAPRMALPSRL